MHCIDPSVCFENAFHTGSKYDVDVSTTSLSFPREPNSYSWFPCFCQMHPSQWTYQMRPVWNSSFNMDCVRQYPSALFCATLPPSPTLFFRGITVTVPLFFGRLVTVIQVREVHRVLDFYSVVVVSALFLGSRRGGH